MKTLLSIASILALGACNLDVPDLNNPGIDSLENNPTPSAVSAACTGLLIGDRGNVAAENGYVVQTGILGREAFNFDGADPRYVGEMLVGKLNAGSPFGGNFWAGPYANIRLGNIILHAIDKIADYTAEQKSAITGYVDTIMALDLLQVIETHDSNGAVVDTDVDIDTISPIVDKDMAYTKIASLLDDGFTALGNGGDAFPFPLSSGYAGFDAPMTFGQFNRAIRARVAAFTADYPTVLSALADSFINPAAATLDDLNVGVYHTFSTASGDATNGLINPNIYVNPDIQAEVTAYTGMANGDARFNRKVGTTTTPGSAQGLTSPLVFTIYTGPTSSVPIIRNEELILLKAEAEIEGGDPTSGTTDLNTVMTVSGGLPALAAGAATESDLIYNRNLSLLFEGGFRWIDARRFGLAPTDVGGLATSDQGVALQVNIRYPIPLTECNARPASEPACAGGSI